MREDAHQERALSPEDKITFLLTKFDAIGEWRDIGYCSEKSLEVWVSNIVDDPSGEKIKQICIAITGHNSIFENITKRAFGGYKLSGFDIDQLEIIANIIIESGVELKE